MPVTSTLSAEASHGGGAGTARYTSSNLECPGFVPSVRLRYAHVLTYFDLVNSDDAWTNQDLHPDIALTKTIEIFPERSTTHESVQVPTVSTNLLGFIQMATTIIVLLCYLNIMWALWRRRPTTTTSHMKAR